MRPRTAEGSTHPASFAPLVGIEGVAAVDDLRAVGADGESLGVDVDELRPLGEVDGEVRVVDGGDARSTLAPPQVPESPASPVSHRHNASRLNHTPHETDLNSGKNGCQKTWTDSRKRRRRRAVVLALLGEAASAAYVRFQSTCARRSS